VCGGGGLNKMISHSNVIWKDLHFVFREGGVTMGLHTQKVVWDYRELISDKQSINLLTLSFRNY